MALILRNLSSLHHWLFSQLAEAEALERETIARKEESAARSKLRAPFPSLLLLLEFIFF